MWLCSARLPLIAPLCRRPCLQTITTKETLTYLILQAEFHAHDDEVDLEDFCDIMERHQPENLIVTNWGGSDGGDSDGEGSDNSDDPNDSAAGGRSNRKGTGAGAVGSGGTGAGGGKVAVTREEVISNLVELFKEVREFVQIT